MTEYDRLKKQFDEIEERQRSAHEKALRNCYFLARRRDNMDPDGGWKHVIRWCEEAGLRPSLLREDGVAPTEPQADSEEKL